MVQLNLDNWNLPGNIDIFKVLGIRVIVLGVKPVCVGRSPLESELARKQLEERVNELSWSIRAFELSRVWNTGSELARK